MDVFLHETNSSNLKTDGFPIGISSSRGPFSGAKLLFFWGGVDEDCDRNDLPSLTDVGFSERLSSGPMKFWLAHYVRIPCHRATLQSRNREGCL